MLSFATTKILLNGALGILICDKWGLLLGPLSPLLFVKVMVVLNYLIQKVIYEGLLLDL
jgi:hypothetical protein